MSETGSHEPKHESHESTDVSPKTIALLERLDSWAHVVVAVFFLLMATGALTASAIVFVRQLPYLASSYTPDKEAGRSVASATQEAGLSGGDKKPESATGKAPTESATTQGSDKRSESEAGKAPTESAATQEPAPPKSEEKKHVHPFIYASLELLSSLLFAVIILELLRTIITYLQSHDTQAIMKEFLIVGIISSVRKILMVGAESSLSNTEGIAFIQKSIGVVISVVAILLMIGGLIMLNRHYAAVGETTSSKE